MKSSILWLFVIGMLFVSCGLMKDAEGALVQVITGTTEAVVNQVIEESVSQIEQSALQENK
jgi:hypothetical protein